MNVVVVIAPRASWRSNRGFRHAVEVGSSKSLCGLDVDDWQGDFDGVDAVPFDVARVGCRSCIRVHAARMRKNHLHDLR